MRRESHVRFCEGGGVRLPSATRLWLFPLPIHYGKGARGLGLSHTNWDPLFPFDVKIGRQRVLFSCRTGRELWKATALRPVPLAPCTFLVVRTRGCSRAVGLRLTANKRFCDALSTSPQAGCLTRSQSLWTLWATPSARFWSVFKLALELGRPPGAPCGPPRL